MPVRAVADTNVLISAVYAGGKPREILNLALTAEIDLYLSPFILREVAGVLARKFSWPVADIRSTVHLLQHLHLINPGKARLRVIRDLPDNRILECALAAKAHYLITGDRDLLALRTYRRIHVVTPAEFLVRERA